MDHDVLTRVGPGTPMGALMREYWVPALMSAELVADGTPLRLRLLGENLIAFRTGSGKVGVLDQRCPHRCASLFYGRNEHDGLRCVYHGWKFDADGRCLEQPNVDPPPTRIEVRAKAYPTVERFGLIWTYMGKRDRPPPLPDFPVFSMPPDRVSVWCEQRECNYLQCIEGELDTSHAGLLHHGGAPGRAGPQGSGLDADYPAVKYKVANTDYGMFAGGYRPAGGDRLYWRFAHFLFPFWTQPPPCALGTEAVARAWVPMDDTHTMLFAISTDTFVMAHHRNALLPPEQPGLSFMYEFLPNTSDWHGRWRLATNQRNDYRIDRAVQRDGSFSGIEGLDVQDSAVQESMGAIVDRGFEHLVAADVAVVQARRRLHDAAIEWRDRQAPPPGLDRPETYRTWSGHIVAPAQTDWLEVYADNVPKDAMTKARAEPAARYGN